MRRVLSVFLAVVIIVGMVPMSVFQVNAETEYTEGYYTYYTGYDWAFITDVNTSISGLVTIPSTLGGKTVRYIGDYAFADCTKITGVQFPDSIESVSQYAFYNCSSLRDVYINDLKSWCEIDFHPLTVSNPLYYAQNLYVNGVLTTDVEIPEGTTIINDGVFENWDGITSVKIPDTVKTIGYQVFFGCSNLKEVYISKNVSQIGAEAFAWCDSLVGVYIEDIYAWCNIDFEDDLSNPLNYARNLYLNNVLVTELPSDVESIKPYSFIGCSSLTHVSIASKITKIGKFAFSNCSNLVTVTLPSTLESIENDAFSDCSLLEQIDIPTTVTSIGDNTFKNCKKITKMKIPSGVTTIGNSTFYNCESLETIELPNALTSIGNSAFYSCKKITTIKIPNGVTTIGKDAFSNCSLLEQIDIPTTVTSIGDNTFKNCAKITKMKIPSGVTTIGNSTFYNCESLETIELPNALTSIGNSAFYSCKKITAIKIPNGVTTIGKDAFRYCESLEIVELPNTLTSIGDSAFMSCKKIINIEIPSGVTAINANLFKYCSSLENVSIPLNVISIGKEAFYWCTQLRTIELPNTVITIGKNAFYYTPLKNIYFYGTKAEWDAISINAENEDISQASIHYCTTICSEATCTEDGVVEHSCSCCDYTNTVITPALGHQIVDAVVTPSTPTDFGYTTYTCSRCGETYKTNWTAPAESVSGTCGENAVWAFNEATGVLTIDGTGAVDSYTSVTAPWNIYSNQIYAVDIRSDITAIGDDAFSTCNKIVEIKNDSDIQLEKGSSLNGSIAKNAKNIYSSNNGQSHLTYQDAFVFITDGEVGCLVDYKGSLTVLELPEEYVAYNGSTISSYSLQDYSLSLKSTLSKVILPSSVIKIDKHTFANSAAITDFYIYNYNCNIFSDVATLLNTATIHGYYGSTAEEYATTYGNSFVSVTVDFPYGICGDTATWSLNPDTGVLTVSGSGSISDYEIGMAPWYAYKDEIESIYIESGITEIGNYAFYDLSNVTYVELGCSVKTIGANAFEHCGSIKNITLPETITEISSGAFKDCTLLENIIIPDDVTAIQADTFNGCTALQSITIGADVTTIDSTAFENCIAITTVKMRGTPPSTSAGVFGEAVGKYVYYYDTITAWNIVITDGLWNGYTAIPYSIVSELGFNGNNVFAVKVVDKYNEPISNATVSFGTIVKSTNNDGLVYFVNNNNTCELSVSASGFASFTDKNYTVDTNQFTEFIVLSDSPSTITGVNCNGKSIATSIVKFNCNSSDSVSISVSGNSPRTILKYELIQGNRVLSTVYSSDNHADFNVKANNFEEGEAVAVKMYISDGTYVAAALNIQPLHIATVTADGLVGSKDNTNINLPLIGSFPFNLEMAGIASTSIVLQEDTIKVGFNIEISEDMSDTAIQKAIKEAKAKSKILSAKPKDEMNAEIAGYIEIKYLGNGEYVVTKSSVSVAFVANLGAGLQASFAGVIGVYFNAELTGKGELELEIVGYEVEEGYQIDDLDLTIEDALKIEGGVYLLWGAGKAGFYGKGEAGFTVEIAPEFGLEHVYVKGDVGVNWSVLWGWIRGSRSIWSGTLFEEPENYGKIRMLYATRVNAILSDSDNYMLNDRVYLNERSEWMGDTVLKTRNISAEYYSSIQENVYYNIAPQIVTCNGITMMVWLDDNADRDINNYQTLYYSIYDAATKTWAKPVQIDNNDTFDCEFDLFTDGNDIYVVYTEKTTLENNIEDLDIENEQQIAELIADVEVRICTFDGQSFSLPISLTSNTCCETLPKLQMVDGVLTAMWSTMEPLGIAGISERDNTIYSSQLMDGEWSVPTVMVENSHQILSVARGELADGTFTAYIVDTDGKNETGDDYALILTDENGKYMQVSSGFIKNLEFVCVNGLNVLMWCDDSNIYYLTSSIASKKQLFAENMFFDGSFKTVAVDDETVLVTYIAANEDASGTDIYGVYFNGGAIIGSPFKITNTTSHIDDFDIVYQDGNFIISFIETAAEFVGEELVTTSDFKYLILPYSSDISISAVDYDITTVTPGENFEATVSVENIGNASVAGLNIYLYNNNYEIVGTTEYNKTILQGDTADITAVFTAPTDISSENYYIEVQPIEMNDKDTSNNEAEILLGYADLSVKIKRKGIGNKYYLLFSVTNNGNIDANADIPVYRNKGGEIITSINDAVIKAGETEEYLVDASTIDDDTLVYVKVKTQEYDPCSINDDDLIPCVKLIYVDSNGNAAPNPVLSTTGVNYNKNTDSVVEITIESGAENFTGIDGLTEDTEYTFNGSVVIITSSYLQTLSNGVNQLKFLFDYQLETSVGRTLTITVFDSSANLVTGNIQIDGEANIGNTLYADLSGLEPYVNVFDYVWTVDTEVVGTEDSYTVKAEDYGKAITLTVTAKDGFSGSFSDSAIVSYNEPKAPVSPVIVSVKDTSVQLVAVDGIEYSLDGSNWQASSIFENLLPNTEYTFYARLKATEISYASPASVGVYVKTPKSVVPAPDAPTVESKTDSTVVLKAVNGYEYRCNDGEWQTSNVFTGLAVYTEYSFYQRVAESDTNYVSDSSGALVVKTEKQTVWAPVAPEIYSKTHNTITLVANASMEYRIEGGEWTDNNVFTNLLPNTTYVFYQRYKETDTAYASAYSSTSFTTEDKISISGTIKIKGEPQYKEILTVDLTGFIGDVNCISYQWFVDGIAISDAVQNTYTVTLDDMGKTIEVKVIGTGAYKGELTATIFIRDYVIGDMDGDKEITIRDATILRRYVAKWEGVTVNELAADVNNDGLVNIRDVTILRRYVAKWDGYEKLPQAD